MAEEKQSNTPNQLEQTKTNATTVGSTDASKESASQNQSVDKSTNGTPGTTTSTANKEDKQPIKNQGSRRRKRSDSNRRSSRRRPERERSEFEQRIIGIRRVTRVVAGGRRFSFSVAMVVGDRKGRVGVGLGKSTDTALAIDKAVRDAKKNMVKIAFTEDNSVPHELRAKFKASLVEIRPAPGRGLVAGSSVRDVLELAGAQNISAKLLSRSKNKINNARCAIKALAPISTKARVSLQKPEAPRRDRSRRGPKHRG